MSPLPRAARAPLTSKHPDACPHCGSHNVRRRGTRKKKLEIVQLWRCASCKRVFTPGPAALHNKTYPLRMILSALTDYNLGYSLAETAARLKKKTNRTVSPSTITNWLHEYRKHCSYVRLRAAGRVRFRPEETIRSIKLYHRQIYAFAYHRPKLEFLRRGTLDDKRAGLALNALAVFGNSILSGPSVTYLNFGATPGETGYGIRDNAGTMEFKNSGGSWSSLAAAIQNYFSSGSSNTVAQIKFSDGTTQTTASAGPGMAKAWVNFNGTNGAIRAAYNISSVVRTGVGKYTINFAAPMADTNYVIVSGPSLSPLANTYYASDVGLQTPYAPTLTSFSVAYQVKSNASAYEDSAYIFS